MGCGLRLAVQVRREPTVRTRTLAVCPRFSCDDVLRSCTHSLEPRYRQIGLGKEAGISTYYSADITLADVELVQRYRVRCCLPLRVRFWIRPTVD